MLIWFLRIEEALLGFEDLIGAEGGFGWLIEVLHHRRFGGEGTTGDDAGIVFEGGGIAGAQVWIFTGYKAHATWLITHWIEWLAPPLTLPVDDWFQVSWEIIGDGVAAAVEGFVEVHIELDRDRVAIE